MSWTEERVSELVRMKKAGHTHAEIADYLGIHRGSVSSKLSHMKRPPNVSAREVLKARIK